MRRIPSLILAAACAAAVACNGDSPVSPTPSDLTGTWSGTGNYPNAPFQLVLTQTGTTLRGEYTDQHDRSTSVSGSYTNPGFTISVNFGDAGLVLNGSLVTARTAQGTMFTPSLGNQVFAFTMAR